MSYFTSALWPVCSFIEYLSVLGARDIAGNKTEKLPPSEATEPESRELPDVISSDRKCTAHRDGITDAGSNRSAKPKSEGLSRKRKS